MEPNPPISRFRHVLKTYKDSKSPWVVTGTGVISLFLTSQDEAGYRFKRLVSAFEMFLTDRAGWPPDVRKGTREDREDLVTFVHESMDIWWPREGYIDVDQWIRQVTPDAQGKGYERLNGMDTEHLVEMAWRLVDLFMQEHLPPNHPHDFLIPWIARELGRASKRVWRDVGYTLYTHLTMTLVDSAPAIAMWAEKENVDLSRTSAREAFKAIKDFDTRDEVPQGEVVYEFKDGWTVQRLTERDHLIAEGEAMQHCVGDYCVEGGITAILSLRDARGMPHVTMEWDKEREQFVQIKGKQNQEPVDKYHPYLFEFIDKKYGGDPIGLLLAGMDPQDVDFSGKVLSDIDFGELDGDRDFSGIDFAGATIKDCDLSNINLRESNFSDTQLYRCTFLNTDMHSSDVESAYLEDVKFSDTNLFNVSFIDATFQEVDFRGYSGDTNLRQASFDNVIIHGPGGTSGMSLPGFIHLLEGADFVNSELGAEHIPEDIFENRMDYAKRLARVANIANTPLEEWIWRYG